MTNKIEQEFYKCYEIEKRCLHPKECRHKGICRGVVACDHYTYPPIIDKILLELICILSKTGSLEFNGVCSVEEIKEELLKTLIECEKDTGKIKHKVQQLFKEYE